MEKGINIVTDLSPVIVEGAEELIEQYNSGSISREELYAKILEADTVFVDRSAAKPFKDSRK